MFSREFAFWLHINYIYIIMHVDKTCSKKIPFSRVTSRGLKWEDKAYKLKSYTSKSVITTAEVTLSRWRQTVRLRLHRYRTIFRSAEKFHRPLRSHEAVQYFRNVQTEFWTARRLNFTVKVVWTEHLNARFFNGSKIRAVPGSLRKQPFHLSPNHFFSPWETSASRRQKFHTDDVNLCLHN